MTIQERAEQAAQLKMTAKRNCAQAVTAVLADQTGMEEEQLRLASAGFAVGMGTLEATCGSLVGAVIAAGYATKGEGSVRMAKRILLDFKERCGAVTCRDLKEETDGKPLCPCEDCVRNAVLAYGKVMGLE